METESKYKIDRLETMAQLEGLEKDWSELFHAIPGAPIFLTWEWIRTWWLFYGKGRHLWLLTARDEQGRLVGIAPWMVENQKLSVLNVRLIAFIGSGLVSPVHLNLIAQQALQPGLLQAFMNFLHSHSDQWDAVRFETVAQESALNQLSNIKGACAGTKVCSPYILLPDSWDAYAKTLTRKLRRNLKYFRSKLEGDYPGEVSFRCLTNHEEVDSAMQKLEELNRARRHDQGLSSAFDDSVFCSFHAAMAHLALDKGWLRLYKLSVQERTIALFHCFRCQDHLYAYQIGFDLEWKGYSPGRLLIAYGIQSAIQEGVCELDWLSGQHDYKLAWTDKIREENEILFPGGWRGRLWIGEKNIRANLKEKVKQMLPQATQLRIRQLLTARPKNNDIPAEKEEKEEE